MCMHICVHIDMYIEVSDQHWPQSASTLDFEAESPTEPSTY